jgi:hypothetical protein
MKFLPTEARTYLVFCLGAQILNVHNLNTNLNYLSSNILSLYCKKKKKSLTELPISADLKNAEA